VKRLRTVESQLHYKARDKPVIELNRKHETEFLTPLDAALMSIK